MRGANVRGIPLISIVIPVYNEALHLRSHIEAIIERAHADGVAYELILIDDGSTDRTWDICEQLSQELPGVRALKFSRNFGKEAAILCGLQEAHGDAAIVMDSDLQHPPDLVPKMIAHWRDEGYDIVEARKVRRGNESVVRRWMANGFYQTMRFLSGFDLKGAADFKLLDRKVVDAYIDMPETNRFFRGLIAWLGFNKIEVPFDIPVDDNRKSRWSFGKLIKLSLGAVSAFSYIPLQLITLVGFLSFIFSLILAAQTLYMKFAGGAVEGFTTVILIVLFSGSLTMLSLGVIGGYLARIYEELKRRPSYVVTEQAGKSAHAADEVGVKKTLHTL